MLQNFPTTSCRCPVCQLTFENMDYLDQTRRWPRDEEDRIFYLCGQKHSPLEIWQAWRRVYGVDKPI
jgi:hypothetical protein